MARDGDEWKTACAGWCGRVLPVRLMRRTNVYEYFCPECYVEREPVGADGFRRRPGRREGDPDAMTGEEAGRGRGE